MDQMGLMGNLDNLDLKVIKNDFENLNANL